MITQGLSRRRVLLATAGTMLALLLAALDQTIVGTAIPRIVADLNGLDRLAWVTTAYLVTSTTMTPIAGKLGDLFGRKPFLLAGMIGFVIASAFCGLAQDMNQLIVFRGIQGLFGGVLFATVFTVIGDLFPPDQRGRTAGLFGGVFGLSSIIGPTTGGFITDHFSWRWVFEVNIPVGIIAVLVVLAGLPYVRSKASWRDIDFWGAPTLAAGIVPLLIALSITRDHAWTSPQVTGLLAIAAAMLAAFVFVESRAKQPIVPLHLFKNPTFSVSMIVGFITAFGMFGSILFTPLVFQGVLGISATNSRADYPDDVRPARSEHGDRFHHAADQVLPLPGHRRRRGDDRRHVDAVPDHALLAGVAGGCRPDRGRRWARRHLPAVPDGGPDRLAAAVPGRCLEPDPVLAQPRRHRRQRHPGRRACEPADRLPQHTAI